MDSPFPSYRDRYLPAMTPARIAALPDKSWAPVIVATGAIEQHGPHLPVAVDSLLGQVWLSLAIARLPAGASCYVAPPITVGKSNEHTGFAGTLMISKESLRALLLAIARQVRSWGFRNLAVINTHGGNTAVVATTLREIRAVMGLRADFLHLRISPEISEREAAFGMHANEIETSWLLAIEGSRVKFGAALRDYPPGSETPGNLRPERAPVTYAWATRDISKSGIIGDATLATAAKGAVWLDQGVASLTKAIAGFRPPAES